MNITSPTQKGNTPDLKINIPDRCFFHRQPGVNGLGSASVFAREIHKVVPELFRNRQS